MNAPIKGDMSILFPLLLIMGMNARGGPGKTTVQSAGKEQVTAETVNKEAEMDYYNEDLDIENNQDENYEPKENLAVRTNMGNPYTILSEIAPYLPNPHKKRLYSVFAIQEMIDKIRNREYEYDALSVELDERERMNGLLKLLLSKLQIPGLKQVTDMMNNISNIQRIISMMGGMDAFKNGGLTGLLQNSPSQAPPQKRNPPEPYDEPVVEAASFKGGKTVDGLLTKQQKNSLARMLNSAKC